MKSRKARKPRYKLSNKEMHEAALAVAARAKEFFNPRQPVNAALVSLAKASTAIREAMVALEALKPNVRIGRTYFDNTAPVAGSKLNEN